MPTPKIDPKIIFASDAPAQDKPAVFNNYTKGMDETRKNNGRPTIKQSNALQQATDQKILWIHENGAALPYDETIDYVEGSIVLKDGELQEKSGAEWISLTSNTLKGYTSLAGANADIANMKVGQVVTIASDEDGGLYYKATEGATSLTKSPYDPLTQAKADATTKANAAEANAKDYAKPVVDVYVKLNYEGYAVAWVSPDPENSAIINIAGGIKDDGTLHFNEQLLQKLVANIAVLDDLSVTNQINGRTIPQITDVIAGYVSNTFDNEMKACGGIKDDGTLHYHSAEFEYLNNVKVSDFLNGNSSNIYPKFDAEINFIVGHGQSLFQGQTPAVTTTQKYDTIAFKGHAINPTAWSVATAATAAAANQEIPTLGASEYVKDLILEENEISMTQQNYQLLLGNGAYGGQSIAALSKGGSTGGYEELMSQIQSGYTISQSQNKVFKVPCIMWVQGEADYWKSQKEYYDSLIKLRNDFDADAKAINGQTEDVVLIASQTTSWGQTDYSRNVQLAMVQAAEDDPNIIISAPQYMYQYRDDTYFAHISPAQTRILGAYMGLAYKRHIIDGVEWQPLKMVKAQSQGNIIYVTFNKSGLVIDNTLVPAQTNAGFSLRKSDNTEITITSVSVVQPNVIKIVASSNPRNSDLWLGGKLATGINFYKGGATNIRDNQGDTLTFDSYPLHNWAVIHKAKVV